MVDNQLRRRSIRLNTELVEAATIASEMHVLRPDIDSNHSTNTPGVLALLTLSAPSTTPGSNVELAALLEIGIPRACVFALICNVGLTDAEVSSVLHIGMRTLKSWRAAREMPRPLTSLQSSQLWLLGVVVEQARNTCGNYVLAMEWLRHSQLGLNGRKPIDLLRTPIGTEAVLTLLKQIEHGVYV